MRKLLITASLAAMLPLSPVLAQVDVPTNAPAGATGIDTTTVMETPGKTVPPVTSVPGAVAPGSAAPGPDGVIRQWGPQQTVVQTTPPPASSYPPCNAQRQDSCKNPDPSRELPYYPGEDRPGA